MIRILPHEKIDILSKYKDIIEELELIKYTGTVERVVGLTIESIGPDVEYGELCKIRLDRGGYLFAEVVGFNKNRVILMPIGDMKGIMPGADVIAAGTALMVPVGDELLGRVISGVGAPLDGKGEIYTKGRYPVTAEPINPLERTVIDRPLSVGIRAIDGLNTVGRGQRIGIFSGSGVGKSTLIAMISRYTDADVNVVALIGERGREVKDFVEKELGPEGLRKSVVVVATSNQPAMMRIRGAYLAHAIAEYFRDKGKHVNLLMDSITRFSMAQREVGIAAGEPSSMRGYPPSTFSLMAKLMERAGTIATGGSITGFYSVLVEADDMNEPIADHARSILDGHIVLERRLAHKGHYPAIDVLQSISRCMKDVVTPEHNAAANRFRELLAAYTEHEDEISLGAYAKGSVPAVDRALEMMDRMNAFLRQGIYEQDYFDDIVKKLIDMFAERRAPVRPDIITRTPAFARIVR
ncbi:MAG TPA: FliI/YscN family ATPase [Spirochaetota bacterium]|nr:FliI/YscN family ATPase [Spirochaetota bacterium]HPC42203.1 FliI/YscN family ATPase [Spirochaetota bacterium]HPL16589.1 FliI/YscN family ATPase [Spirochaetota bacterium]HQF08227.1 FliI/YscN family ATPase [Spirochaetota bacterium]HQH97158.1 FliI/YscN family ATPase [Spirochaetota bacterium]